MTGYSVAALDGEIGQVKDYLIETGYWSIRGVVVTTGSWFSNKRVVVSPEWFKDVNWSNNTVVVDLARGQIKCAPEYDPRTPINRDYEGRLFDYYGRPRYW